MGPDLVERRIFEIEEVVDRLATFSLLESTLLVKAMVGKTV